METIRKVLIKAMEAYFNGDTRRIDHARQVTEYAEGLLEPEGGDYSVVMGAAVLHDIGIPEAERKYGRSTGRYQEIEGPPIARSILTELDFTSGQIEEICEIIAHHHSPGKILTRNFSILYDADWLVNLKDTYDITNRKKLARIIDRVFLTASGREKAREIYLPEGT